MRAVGEMQPTARCINDPTDLVTGVAGLDTFHERQARSKSDQEYSEPLFITDERHRHTLQVNGGDGAVGGGLPLDTD